MPGQTPSGPAPGFLGLWQPWKGLCFPLVTSGNAFFLWPFQILPPYDEIQALFTKVCLRKLISASVSKNQDSTGNLEFVLSFCLGKC